MYMLTDTSKDYSDTWDFLDRQVDNVLNVTYTTLAYFLTFHVFSQA